MPPTSVELWTAFLVFSGLLIATVVAGWMDERRERLKDGHQKTDAARRIREFQATQNARRGR